ncbi:MAG TPA: hypothetical protein ENK02_06220 [Planctomycetes bacterium]|nr:hypothetical protein [Planctomycetota bacterium]
MLAILFSTAPLLLNGALPPTPQNGKASKPAQEETARFQNYAFQIPKEWRKAKTQGKTLRWVLVGKNGKSLSMSMGTLETRLSPQQYLVDRLGRLGGKATPKYYGGDSSGIPYLGVEFLMNAGKEKDQRTRTLIAVFSPGSKKIRFVATGDGDLLLSQRAAIKRLLFTFRGWGKPLPQRLPDPEPAKPRSMPSLSSPGPTASRPSKSGVAPSKPISGQPKGWNRTKVMDLTLFFPKAWVQRQPSNNMRLLELHLKGSDGEGVLVAYYFGPSSGSIRMNLDRWKGQFQDPKNVQEKEIKGARFKTTLLSLDGIYGGGMSGKKIQGRSRLFAWITRTPKGPFYFKLVAPKKTVDQWEADLLKVAQQIR